MHPGGNAVARTPHLLLAAVSQRRSVRARIRSLVESRGDDDGDSGGGGGGGDGNKDEPVRLLKDTREGRGHDEREDERCTAYKRQTQRVYHRVTLGSARTTEHDLADDDDDDGGDNNNNNDGTTTRPRNTVMRARVGELTYCSTCRKRATNGKRTRTWTSFLACTHSLRSHVQRDLTVVLGRACLAPNHS